MPQIVNKHSSDLSMRISELAKLPVQTIWGEDDAWQDIAWAHKLHNAIPKSELHILKNCGHFAMEDKPAEISQHLIDFLASHTNQETNSCN